MTDKCASARHGSVKYRRQQDTRDTGDTWNRQVDRGQHIDRGYLAFAFFCVTFGGCVGRFLREAGIAALLCVCGTYGKGGEKEGGGRARIGTAGFKSFKGTRIPTSSTLLRLQAANEGALWHGRV